MQKQIISGALIGGLVFFVWSFVWHLLLPFNEAAVKKFQNETVLEPMLDAGAPEDGVYVIPRGPLPDEDLDPDVRKKLEEETMTQFMEGFFMFAVVRKTGTRPFVTALGLQLVLDLVIAGFLSWFVLRGGITGIKSTTCAVTAVAFVGWLMQAAPNWIWWCFSDEYTIASLSETLVGWSAAGVAMGWWFSRNRS